MHNVTIKLACQRIHVGFRAAVRKLAIYLRSHGYADKTVSFYEEGAVHFSFWMAKRRISPSQLKESHIADFLSRHVPKCDCPVVGVRQHNTVRAGLVHFAAILRDAGYLTHAKTSVEGIDREVHPSTTTCSRPSGCRVRPVSIGGDMSGSYFTSSFPTAM